MNKYSATPAPGPVHSIRCSISSRQTDVSSSYRVSWPWRSVTTKLWPSRGTTDYSFKLTGSFDLPAGIRLSPVYRFQAGTNFARTFVATLNYANPTLNAEPMNTNRTAHVNLIDIRIDRAITIGGNRLVPFLISTTSQQQRGAEHQVSWARRGCVRSTSSRRG